METKIIKLTEEEILTILDRLSVVDKNIDEVSQKKISALYNKLLFFGADEDNVVVYNALHSLDWVTPDCISEVKRLWALPRQADNEKSPKVEAVKLIMALGESNGFKITLLKAKEIVDKLLGIDKPF